MARVEVCDAAYLGGIVLDGIDLAQANRSWATFAEHAPVHALIDPYFP